MRLSCEMAGTAKPFMGNKCPSATLDSASRTSQTSWNRLRLPGCSEAVWDVATNIGLDYSMDATFTTPCILDSKLPAILGGETLNRMRCLIDCGNDEISGT